MMFLLRSGNSFQFNFAMVMSKTGLPILMVVFLFCSCRQNNETVKPITSGITESVYASGIIKSKDQYEVYSTASGIIKEIFVKEGDLVEAGTPLLLISSESQRLSKSNAELAAVLSDFNANQGKLNEAKLQEELAYSKMKNDSLLYYRQLSLWQQQIGSKMELEQRELNYENSKTAWYSSRVRREDLTRQLDIAAKQAANNIRIAASLGGDYLLKSEIKGKVFLLFKSKGEIVSPQTPVAIIGSASEFIIELQVDEDDIPRIELGQKVFVTMDAYKGKVFEAIVNRILPIMDERTKSFKVEAAFTKAPAKLYPNNTLEANILINEKKKAILLPRSFVINDSMVNRKNGGLTRIKTGLKNYQYIEVISGISADDEILKPGK
jgi:multidrug efflux pump subunit AcrA (membrane-fusion protein)